MNTDPPRNKLTPEQRHEIWTQKGKTSGYKLAEKYKVSHTAIYKIWHKKTCPNTEVPLKQIRRELEKTRGYAMEDSLFYMWINIYTIVNEALGDLP